MAADGSSPQYGFVIDQERRGLRPRTITRREYTLRSLTRWLQPRSLLDATADDLTDWLDSRRLGPKGRYCDISTVHVFFEYAIREGLTEVDPTVRLTRPRLRRGVPRPISDEDLAMAIAMASPVMRAWLSLAAFEGLRCMEIAALCREDVLDLHRPPLLVVVDGKGGQQRVLPLNEFVEQSLRRMEMPRSGPLFRSSTGQPASPSAVSRTISSYLRGLGIASTAHSLRHYFGTRFYGETLDLRLTQAMMGHASVTTTTIYVAFNPVKAVPVVRTMSPKAVTHGN